MMVLKQAPHPEDILTLGVEDVNQIWQDAKIRAVGKRGHESWLKLCGIVSEKKLHTADCMEICMLLKDYESRNSRLQEIMLLIEELVKQIPITEKMMEIRSVGTKNVSGFLAEAGDITCFNNSKELRKLAGEALVENSSGKHKGQTTISRRGRKRLRYLLFEVAMSLVGNNLEFGELHHY